MSRRYAMLLGLLVAIALAVVACSNEDEGGKVTVTLKEYSLIVDPAIVAEGPVEIEIKNEGEKQHSLLIIKTSLEPGDLPTEDDGSVDKGGADVDVQHEVDEIDDGDDTSRTYNLDPGTYVLVSNEVHEEDDTKIADYSEGMYASLTVFEEFASATGAASGSPSKTP